MLGVTRDQLVHLRHMLHRATHQVGNEGIALGLLFGIEGVVIRVDDFLGSLPAGVPQKQDL